MTIRAREHRHVHPVPLLASNDALASTNTAISERIAKASLRRRTSHRAKTAKEQKHPKRGGQARGRTSHAARRATSTWTRMPRTSQGSKKLGLHQPLGRQATPAAAPPHKCEAATTLWGQGLPAGFQKRQFDTSSY